MDWEKLATSAVVTAISKTEKLKAYINTEDKEPSYDGYICIYSDNRYLKEDIKKVPVQVKGKGVTAQSKAEIRYSISIRDLKAYLKNGGVMFFVVYLDKRTGETKQIYYSALLPLKIQTILTKYDLSKANVSLTFSKLPDTSKEITELFFNFYSNAKKQISFVGKQLPSIENLQQQGMLESISFSYVSEGRILKEQTIPKILDGKDIYIYANIKGGIASIPIKLCSAISNVMLSSKRQIIVSVNGVKYYDHIHISYTAKQIICYIGSSVKLFVPNVTEDLSIRSKDGEYRIDFRIELKGTLRQRICALRFLIAAFKTRFFTLGENIVPIELPSTDNVEQTVCNLSQTLIKYNRLQTVLNKLNVEKDLEMDNLTVRDFWNIDALLGEHGIQTNSIFNDLKGVFCSLYLT